MSSFPAYNNMATAVKATRITKTIKKKKQDKSKDGILFGEKGMGTNEISSEASLCQPAGLHSQNKIRKKKKNEGLTRKEMKKTKKRQEKNIGNSTTSSEKKMKKSFKNLKDTDPEFYDFLQKEDQDLLEFVDSNEVDGGDELGDESDSDDADDLIQEQNGQKQKNKRAAAAARKAFEKEILDMSSEPDDSDTGDEEDEGLFQPSGKLQVASDDEDDDASDNADDSKQQRKSQGKLITPAMVKEWTKQLQISPSPKVLQDLVDALSAAAQQAGIAGEISTPYRVAGSKVFNDILRMCLTETVPALESILKLKSISEQPQLFSQKNKKWRSVKGSVKKYCTLMLQLSAELSEASMINVVLRHIHKLVVCYSAFPKLAKVFLKKLISLWSSGEETSRVLAFLSINKLVRLQPDTMLEPTLRQMYMTYVNNCKFVSPTLLPLITFMQRSLVEMFLVQEGLAYQHAFLYIRQLAIHLRNAITVNKKEKCQTVYNWQYVLSLGLWSQLLSGAYPSATLQPLIYPLVQVIMGTIRLLPTARYYPLRFHCVRYLTTLSGATKTFVPVIPLLLEVFEQTDFNKKQKASSIKSLSMSTILKFSKPQVQEKVFKDAVLDHVCELLLDYLNTQSHTVAFPELIIPLVIQLKDFTKKCKVAALCKQVKQVVDKAEETARVIEARRRVTTFNLADTKAVDLWEAKSKEEGTPLSKFYSSWRKVKDRQLQKDIAGKDEMTTASEDLPKITLSRGPKKATDQERDEFAGLFGNSDDEDDDNDNDSIRFLPKEDKIKKQQDAELDSDEEDYSDFDSDDLEQLAKSASEDDDISDSEEDDKKHKSDHLAKHNRKDAQVSKPGKKRKGNPLAKSVKRGKVEVQNDGGDIVQDFQLSDFDSD